MIRIAVCDDNKLFLNDIVKDLREYLESRKTPYLLYAYTSSFELLEGLERNYVDVFILDIEMPDMSGMEAAKLIKRCQPEAIIIFLTVHSEYAIDAFEVSAFRYVPKQHIGRKLFPAIDEGIRQAQSVSTRSYSFRFGSRLYKLIHKDILHIRKEGKNSVFTTVAKKEYYVRKSLATVFSELASDEFIFINKSCIVNLNYIRKIHEYELLVENGEKLYISRNNLKNVKSRTTQFWGNTI